MANHFPEGQYLDVSCVSPLGHSGRLTGGTGTYTHSTKTFSCGPFPKHDRPLIDSTYNLSGTHKSKRHDFLTWKCTHSGETSDFKAS